MLNVCIDLDLDLDLEMDLEFGLRDIPCIARLFFFSFLVDGSRELLFLWASFQLTALNYIQLIHIIRNIHNLIYLNFFFLFFI